MVFRLKSTNVICLPVILLHLSNDVCLIFSRSTGRVWLRPVERENIRQTSLNNIHKLAKQITPFTSYQDTISFLSEPYRLTPVFYWNRLRAPSLSGEDRIYYFRATHIHLFWNRTGLFYFSVHPIHIPILN